MPDKEPLNVDPTPAGNAQVVIELIESDYKQLIHAMHLLDDVLAAFASRWPITARSGITHRPQNDYDWFCDYLGNATTPIGFAIVGGKRGGDVAPLFREILEQLAARRDEFTRLETRVASEHQAGHINKAQVGRILGALEKVRAGTATIMQHMTLYGTLMASR